MPAAEARSLPSPARAVSRRALLGGLAASLTGCENPLPREAAGRQITTLWFTYGGKNREVLEALIARFHGAQREIWVRAVYQGDYYEGLAKLRVALAAGAAPALSHVVGEVIPYLAEAGVLERLDRYPSIAGAEVVPELGQAGSWRRGTTRALVCLPVNRSRPIVYLTGPLVGKPGEAPGLGRAGKFELLTGAKEPTLAGWCPPGGRPLVQTAGLDRGGTRKGWRL